MFPMHLLREWLRFSRPRFERNAYLANGNTGHDACCDEVSSLVEVKQ